MSDATATAYLGGRHGVPTDELMEAFADTLRIPISTIRAAAGVVTKVGQPWEPPKVSRYLRDDQRQALDRLIVTMVNREGGEADGDAAATNQPGSGPDSGSSGPRLAPAARDVGHKGKAQKAREKQDRAGTESQDDGGMEPL